jgi:hypothetical protein
VTEFEKAVATAAFRHALDVWDGAKPGEFKYTQQDFASGAAWALRSHCVIDIYRALDDLNDVHPGYRHAELALERFEAILKQMGIEL